MSEKALSNRASSRRYYEKNKEKEQEKARLRMASLRSENENGFRFTAINHDANRISSKKFYEKNKEKEREKARRRMALLRAKRKEEASAASVSPDLSDLDGEGDEHLKDIPALEVWRQTFKRELKASSVKRKWDEIVQGDTTTYENQEEENAEKSDLYEALEVEALLRED